VVRPLFRTNVPARDDAGGVSRDHRFGRACAEKWTRASSKPGADPYIASLELELQSTRDSLQTTVEELETSNEELKSANEELQSINEELQSSNEELKPPKRNCNPRMRSF